VERFTTLIIPHCFDTIKTRGTSEFVFVRFVIDLQSNFIGNGIEDRGILRLM
jgi:hypothetical protein